MDNTGQRRIELENRQRGKSLVGSNPTPSAKQPVFFVYIWRRLKLHAKCGQAHDRLGPTRRAPGPVPSFGVSPVANICVSRDSGGSFSYKRPSSARKSGFSEEQSYPLSLLWCDETSAQALRPRRASLLFESAQACRQRIDSGRLLLQSADLPLLRNELLL